MQAAHEYGRSSHLPGTIEANFPLNARISKVEAAKALIRFGVAGKAQLNRVCDGSIEKDPEHTAILDIFDRLPELANSTGNVVFSLSRRGTFTLSGTSTNGPFSYQIQRKGNGSIFLNKKPLTEMDVNEGDFLLVRDLRNPNYRIESPTIDLCRVDALDDTRGAVRGATLRNLQGFWGEAVNEAAVLSNPAQIVARVC